MTDKRPASFLGLPPRAADAFLRTLQWIAAAAGFFAWWLSMLLLASAVLVNVWRVTFETILRASLILTAFSALVYGIVMFRRARK